VPDERPVPRQNTLSRAIVERIVTDYEAGASTHALAERYSVRRATVRDVLRREGIDPSARSHRSKFTPELTAELRQRYDAGATRRELAVLYGVSKSTIGRMLRLRQ
jgi:DNA invertase Pin-like site-specific DNA recombinase